MWWWCAALAAEIVLDAKVASSLSVDGRPVAELHVPGVLHIPVLPGERRIEVEAGGRRYVWTVPLVDGVPMVLLAGRGGVTVGTSSESGAGPASAIAEGTLPEVRFRVAGPSTLVVSIDDRRITVEPGQGVMVALKAGDHPVSVRSVDGADLYARGVLRITGGGDLVVQLSEGRLPETSGAGVSYLSSGR